MQRPSSSALGLRIARREAVRHSFARRAAAGAHRPGSHGQAAAAGARRAVRRHGPRRARAVSGWLNERLVDAIDSGPTTILVTHHIEEIVPGIQNTLILSGGRVHSAGPTARGRSRGTRLKPSTTRGWLGSNAAAAGCGRYGVIVALQRPCKKKGVRIGGLPLECAYQLG